jgi:hypothetical protein
MKMLKTDISGYAHFNEKKQEWSEVNYKFTSLMIEVAQTLAQPQSTI